MASSKRSSILFVTKEDTEGVLKAPAGVDATVLNDGFSFSPALETIESEELKNSIGASKTFATKQTPSASIPKYAKGSGVEGQAPDYGVMIEAAMGVETVNSTEYSTDVGSTAGDTSSRAVVKLTSAEAGNYSLGQALLIKDDVNGYSIRNVYGTDGDTDLTLNYNLSTAPASGKGLGKAVHYAPASSGHPTYSAHLYQSDSGSAFHEAMAGCRTSSVGYTFTANELGSVEFSVEGIEFFYNPITIDASNDTLDFVDDLGVNTAALEHKSYALVSDLVAAVESRMNGASADTITASFDQSTGKVTIASDGTTFELTSTGANTAFGELGYSTLGDATGATSYEADNALSYDPDVAPSYDASEPQLVRKMEVMFGDYFNTDCRNGSEIAITVDTPKTDIDDYCSESGTSESVINERTVSLSGTLALNKHEYDTFKAVLKNEEIPFMLNFGPRDDAGNWKPGLCMNFYLPSVSLTTSEIADEDDIFIINIEGTAFVGDTSLKDIHINYL
jgi:hypothetical protein